MSSIDLSYSLAILIPLSGVLIAHLFVADVFLKSRQTHREEEGFRR